MKNKAKKVFYLKAKKIHVNVGDELKILLNEEEAWIHEIRAIDHVGILYQWLNGLEEVVVDVDLTQDLVEFGEVWVFQDVYEKYDIHEWNLIGISPIHRHPLSVQAVRKRLFGKKLTEKEITALVHDMADNKISDTLVTYYAACSFFYKSRREELYYTAKASAEYGNVMRFGGVNAVKYCIGGVPGNETTMIMAPIVASLGVNFPKSFSKAITSPTATGECVETLMEIEFTPTQIKKIVKKTWACLAWGKNLGLAPANDRIIKVAYPISMEAYSKMVVSIAAKIFAGGANFCLIDIPVGPTAKIKDKKTAERIKGHFEYIGRRLGMKTKVVITDGKQPIGKWIWSVLQVREVLEILQQTSNRSLELEKKSIFLAAELLRLTGKYRWKNAEKVVREQLESGKAWEKMQEIIKIQAPSTNVFDVSLSDPHVPLFEGEAWNVTPDKMVLAACKKDVLVSKSGEIVSLDMRFLTDVARTLGCPLDKQAGIFLEKRLWNNVKKWNVLFTLYASDEEKIGLAEKMLEERAIYGVEKI